MVRQRSREDGLTRSGEALAHRYPEVHLMGHKVHPNAFRLGVYRTWEANWFALDKDYTKLLHEDLAMRRLIMSRIRKAHIARIKTERSSNAQMTVTIHTAKP